MDEFLEHLSYLIFQAVEDYHNQIGVVSNLILDEFREHFGDALSTGQEANTSEAMESRRQKLIYHLNTSGKYFAFKEQLKHSVVKIVREKYLKTTSFKSKDELQVCYYNVMLLLHYACGEVLWYCWMIQQSNDAGGLGYAM